ncbi:hypothetical protein Q5H93_21250 [Hymenobacter sp. ASUV-10]|uniref:Uncharacterized protein n=1 Tax=Hymenobacter aranciens TaxID=3063996 RepID=A0ABT9BHL1_9BACT|nr:hypothetical protein [Hymenobacter sp. ASUV-10]MDO7877285.1 hypothetical protein [Hymenobacter sp. ASUV-10]
MMLRRLRDAAGAVYHRAGASGLCARRLIARRYLYAADSCLTLRVEGPR